MRINRYVAAATGMSRRAADRAVAEGRVTVNATVATAGQDAQAEDTVALNGTPLALPVTQTILFNKPAGYIVSRDGQGGTTIYDLLPPELHILKPIGRLDKDSSGLLLLTNDGDLAQRLTHPSFAKEKVYEVLLNKSLQPAHYSQIEQGIQLEDSLSRLQLQPLNDGAKAWQITMHEGRNRQIRRTFEALGYRVTRLRRITFGSHKLGNVTPGNYRVI